MTSRERVLQCFRSEQPDRVPLNVFAGWNPEVRTLVDQHHGSVDAFNDRFHIDVVTGVLPRFPFGKEETLHGDQNLDRYLAEAPIDPASPEITGTHYETKLFLNVEEAEGYHRQEKAVFAHVWGVFELSQFLFEKQGMPGTQDALMNMIAEPEKTRQLYLKLAEWSAACMEQAILAGVDVIELSDDWGQQNTMMFSPRMWWDMIYPATKIILDRAQQHDVPVLLHSDGNISLVLDGIKKLGFSGLHPVQESSGMSFEETRSALGPEVCIMGGLDTITALPVMKPEEVRLEVDRIFRALKGSGPYIFAGSHMFQSDAPLPVIEAAYEAAYERAAY